MVDGLRAYKHWFPTGSSANGYTYYLYDGGNAVCELDKDGNLVNTNIYAPDGLVASRTAGGATTSYLFDQQGNTSELMTGGGVSLHTAYNAWGQCNYVDPSTEEGPPYVEHSYNARWGYLGDETGLYYCQNRYYDPGTGRFLTRDPIGYAGGMNLYGYCGGGPVGAIDPSGLETYSGDLSGWAWPAKFAPGNWGAKSPSKVEIIPDIILTDDESLGFFGHGWDGTMWLTGGEEYLNSSDIRLIAKMRKKLGKPKFKNVTINECHVLGSGEMVNAWLDASDSVTGYTGTTIVDPRLTYTEKVPEYLSSSDVGLKYGKPKGAVRRPGSTIASRPSPGIPNPREIILRP